MLNFEKLKSRGLLTETLPYEVPTIFSNEFLFASELSLGRLNAKLQKLISHSEYRRALKTDQYTIPMNFQVRKGLASWNTISVIHPLQQMNIANFLDDYATTIVEECKTSFASLRTPAAVVPFLSNNDLDRFYQNQEEFLLNAPERGLSDVSYAASFFTLKKYNLLDRFYNSNELLRLETRFSSLRTIDVTKCFFNIYTHSIAWAVKEKGFSKKHAARYSFEGRFDQLMQKSNYNETNGIPVGPEVSRIFAEIIFQRIDQNIEAMMLDRHKLTVGVDYTFRRYVDDFFLFAVNDETLNRLTICAHDCLEEYKLFPNQGKQQNFRRPFVTKITLAKKGIVAAASALEQLCLKEFCKNPEDAIDTAEEKHVKKRLKETSRGFREALEDLRIVIGKNDLSFNEVSGPVYTAITKSIDALSKLVNEDSSQYSADVVIRLRGVLRILFYSVASDFRVPPLFKCHQVVDKVRRISQKIGHVHLEVIDALVIFELTQLFETYSHDENIEKLPIEICNLFILAATVNPSLFIQQEPVRKFILEAIVKKDFSYFSFVSLLFLLKHTTSEYEPIMDHIIASVKRKLVEKKTELRVNAEVYLLFSDFVSCPYISTKLRARVVNDVIGVQNLQVNETEIGAVAPHFAFVDWTGTKASYILHRKRLQPVYFSW